MTPKLAFPAPATPGAPLEEAAAANAGGAQHYAEGRYDEACLHFARAAGLAPDSSAYAYNEGASLLMGKHPREAVAAFLRSLHGDALLREAHYWAWAAFGRLGILKDVNTRLRMALDQDPDQAHFEALQQRVELPDVTLCAIDCAVPDLAARALRKSLAQCRFAGAKIFTSHARRYDGIETVTIPHIASIEDYSRFVMKSLGEYVTTQFALVTQWDGYVVNAGAWTREFLDYDYIGARWDESRPENAGRTPDQLVGNGGFSLRSDIFMRAGTDPRFVQTHPEDDWLGKTYRPLLEEGYGIRFAPAVVADRFAFEILLPQTVPCGFHGCFNVCLFEPDPKWMRFEFLDRDILMQ